MTPPTERENLEQNISSHVFSASASLVGISLTCLGLFRISDKLKNILPTQQFFADINRKFQ